jgi:intracellular sulfur oxidation DsrE/DsrF family protein
VQLSYSDVPQPVDANKLSVRRKGAGFWQFGAAASIMLSVGVLFGWLSHGYISGERVISASGEVMSGVQLSPVSMQQANKIVLHVASSKPEKLKQTLSKIESILEQYSENKLPFELEIIANAGGLDLLRKDVSPYRAEIETIMKANSNVSFVACRNTMDRLRASGIEPELIESTKTDFIAVEQIVKRLQQGWVYIKV